MRVFSAKMSYIIVHVKYSNIPSLTTNYNLPSLTSVAIQRILLSYIANGRHMTTCGMKWRSSAVYHGEC